MERGTEMRAQELYDFRLKWEFCSGQGLQEFFHKQDGDPSPSGNEEVNTLEVTSFIMASIETMSQNSPSLAAHCEQTKQDWLVRGLD